MPPEPSPWDRKDFFRERKHERSELLGGGGGGGASGFGGGARWREHPLNHHHYSSSRWVPDFRSRYPPGHGKQGGWHLYQEEPAHGFMVSRSSEKILEDDSGRPSGSRGEGKYSRNGRENSRGSFGQRDWRCHSWETTSPNGPGRLNETNDQRLVDGMMNCHSSQPQSEYVNSRDQSHSRDQNNKSGTNGLGSTGQRVERENSLGSIEWKPLKWTRSGSLSSRGSFSHSNSSKSTGQESNETKAEMHPKNLTPIQSPSGDATACVTSSAPLEETNSRKKPRLGWGEGLAKYEKKKVEGPDDSAIKNCTVNSGNNLEANHSNPVILADKSPQVAGSSDCASPATPSSVACSSSPGLEEKQFVKATHADQDTGDIIGSPCAVSLSHPEDIVFNLEDLDLTKISNLNTKINELLQSDARSFNDSGYIRSTALNKLLVWKSDVSKVVEKTELEIDMLENELKSLNSGTENGCPAPSASSSLPKECESKPFEDQGATPNVSNRLISLEISSFGDTNMGTIHDAHGAEDVKVKILDIDSPGSATSKLVEVPSTDKNVSVSEEKNVEALVMTDVTDCRYLEVENALPSSEEENANEISTCEETSQMIAGDHRSLSDGNLNCSGDDLYNLIFAANKESANRAAEVLNSLLPADGCSFDISRASSSLLVVDPAIKEKVIKRKKHQQFKEKILALKFKVFHYLWKEDTNMLSLRKFRAKSQRKFDLSLRPVHIGHQKHRLSSRSRPSSAVGNLNLLPSSELLNFTSRLLSDSKVKVYRSTERMPALILDKKEKMISRFISNNGLVEDPCSSEKERLMINPWTSEEREIFIDKLATFGKDFSKIASFLDHKTTADCIEFYYKNHKSDCFAKTKRKPGYTKQGKSTYLVASGGKRWNREVNAVSLDILGAASAAVAANVDDEIGFQKCTSKYLLGVTSETKMPRHDELDVSNSLDVCNSDRETVAADVLAGICGSLSSEAMSSCITSSIDPSDGYHEWKYQKVSSSTRRPLTPEVTQSVDDETCSDESCGEMDPTDWTDEEKLMFIQAVSSYGKDFTMISRFVKTRSRDQCKIFFSKARKCLGLDTISPQPGNVVREDANGGGSDAEDACLLETDSSICIKESGIKVGSPNMKLNQELDLAEGMDVKPDLNSSEDNGDNGTGDLDSIDTEHMSNHMSPNACDMDKQEIESDRDIKNEANVVVQGAGNVISSSFQSEPVVDKSGDVCLPDKNCSDVNAGEGDDVAKNSTKGIVFKKNVAHRRMTSKIEKPRILVLGGALEYQRVSNALSSFDTLLQQEMDHLKMAVARIDAHQPDVLLVEKTVSRHAQEYLLAKDISVVLNIKRPLLERIARCTGGQIVPSIDQLSSQKLGHCDMFHVDKFVEEHGTAGQSGKKLAKTLMYFEGCPKPLGCTVLLRGANGDELKKVKHVLQYSVFAAYHLAMETSFLADEGASLPELPLNSPITVALPDKASPMDRSISMIPGFTPPGASEKTQGSPPQRSYSVPAENLLKDYATLYTANGTDCVKSSIASQQGISNPSSNDSFLSYVPVDRSAASSKEEPSGSKNVSDCPRDDLTCNGFRPSEALEVGGVAENVPTCFVVDTNQSVSNSVLQLESKNAPKEPASSKEEFPPSPSDHQSILVSLSSRCVWKGTVCERSHLFRIKYYGNADKPLGRFLRDHLFDQSYICRSCEMPSEAHVHCYTHRQGTLTISVKKLPEFLLPGEKEGKIWMWHRCLKCPRMNGFPPATRRVIMSDAAWGLSFGKFLELSFSNHAAASRVASCGHSLHRDCLRFYGFGKMVACFRYASINVLSVYLPPPKLDFNYENQDWIQQEVNEVKNRAELLFSEVQNALRKLEEQKSSVLLNSGVKLPEARHQMADLEEMLQKEKAEFEESLQKILNKEAKKGQPIVDIFEINRLRRQLLFQSYMWDHRLVYAAASLDNQSHDDADISTSDVDKSLISNDKYTDSDIHVDSSNDLFNSTPVSLNEKPNDSCEEEGVSGSNIYQTNAIIEGDDVDINSKRVIQNPSSFSFIMNNNKYDSLESNVVLARAHSDVFPIIENLSDTLDAAWTGESHSDLARADSLIYRVSEKLDVEDSGEEHKLSQSPLFSSKGTENMEDSMSWLGMPFISFYRSLNKNFLGGSQKLDTLCEYNPVYISSFRESDAQGGARLLLPVGVNDTVIPVYDDEPASLISYALISPDYLLQVSDELDRPKESADPTFSLQSFDSGNILSLQSMEEIALESWKSLGSEYESFLSTNGSRSTDPLSYMKAIHARVSFADDGSQGTAKYTVTCYYAKRFEALRRISCPSEIDFVRSLSRCKKWGAQGGKSNVFFAKTLDDRFILKQVTKTELESFIKFAPAYFKYLSESISSGSPTCLAKILGIYQVTSKHLKGGKETKMDVLVMENLLFSRNLARLYDLKGSSRSRYNADSSGSNKVLLDQNLIESMPTCPIFVGNKAKRLLERAVWNDTSFLASIDVMDYSLLVGVDEEKHELVLGIIDFMRQYTWDKHLETWVKASGILGGPKNAPPTVISPKQYKKRFRKAMTTYFLMIPDQWSPQAITRGKSQTDVAEENTHNTTSAT